jgi:hypothetical protein
MNKGTDDTEGMEQQGRIDVTIVRVMTNGTLMIERSDGTIRLAVPAELKVTISAAS